jgi:hypothetical protein
LVTEGFTIIIIISKGLIQMALFSYLNGHQYTVKQLNQLLDQPDVTVSGTGVSATQATTAIQTIPLTLTNVSVTTTDAAANGAHGTQKLVTFPQGNILILGAVVDLSIARVGTALTATSAVVASLGSVAVANTDATLTSTEANVIASTAATLSSGAGNFEAANTGVVLLNGTSTASEIYLNFATPDAGSTGNDALTVNGTIVISYINLGDIS